MTILTPDDAILISADSRDSDDVRAVIDSNISVVNELRRQHLRAEEISRDALRSYYVDFYLSQVLDGGVARFVYNSRWAPGVGELVTEGLTAMGATRHLVLFGEIAASVADLGAVGLEQFLGSELDGENALRDRLDEASGRFAAVDAVEDLEQLNAAWIRSRPGLAAPPLPELEAAIALRVEALPDRAARVEQALASEPEWLTIIRALCEEAGQEFVQVNGGDPDHDYQGQRVFAWHFTTSAGHHYMLQMDGVAIMFDGGTDEPVAGLDVDPD
jgi:hypothetical protein